ncbi:hypothetical protein NZD88_11015 [Chryseobacterium antibioticum]|uniref:Lipoprotein n=1 Tax=Chryseobacterium pyrolae TaxID=2987481 RepID=A0ABT2IHE0_9FLAO|nr:hypothetical protein [Chryseobacterium pyrolae]MCT2408070.1 hypothetical protein [Chryseobacterium pyrolae]
MLRELKTLSCLISFFILAGCTQKEILVIKGESVDNSAPKIYSPDCYIKNLNQEILIREGFLYKNNILQKYITPQSESLLIDNIKENGNSKETELYKRLELKKENKEIMLFNQKYEILRESADTLFLSHDMIIIESPQSMK